MTHKGSYDPRKDENVASTRAYEGEHTYLMVRVMRYSGGQAKIDIVRERLNREAGDDLRLKLGRLTYEEFAAVARAVKKFADDGLLK